MSKRTVTIELDELRREVREFLRESEKERLVPDPILRIGEIISMMRRFKAAVVNATAPRGFDAGSEHDPRQRALLRSHRLAALGDDDLQSGLVPLKERLMSLNCAFVLQGQPWWVDDCQWETRVWNPLYRWTQRGYDLLFKDHATSDWPTCIKVPILQDWITDEVEIEWELGVRMKEFLPDGEWPHVDLKEGTLRWGGRERHLPKRTLLIIQCLVEKKGRYVHDDYIAEAIQEPDLSRDALRQAFFRLKRSLVDADFGDVAAAIVRDKEEWRTCLDQTLLLEGLAKLGNGSDTCASGSANDDFGSDGE